MDVIHALAPGVEALFLGEQDSDHTDIASSQGVARFARHIRRAEVIWSYHEKYIVKLKNQIVVKYGVAVAIEEASNLKWIGDCARGNSTSDGRCHNWRLEFHIHVIYQKRGSA